MAFFQWVHSSQGSYGTYLAEVFLVAFLATLAGETTLALGYRINRRYLKKLSEDLAEYQKLSDEAERMGDETSYQAVNKVGNEVWGKLFFFKVALSAAALWPVFFGLAWLQARYRHFDLPIPGTSIGLNYVVVFLIAYVAARLMFSRISRKLPFFRTVLGMVDADAAHSDTAPRIHR
ncbi:MAG: hypothetical protein WHS46_11465 [Desulfosoma sp.]